MIITRAPLRLTFGGAPTDLPSYYEKYGGFCISATINKYCYVALNKPFYKKIFLKYAKLEEVEKIEDVSHPIFKECLKLLDSDSLQIEISTMADVPSNGAGLGGSGSFCVALLKAIYLYKRQFISSEKIAEIACDISINKLKKAQGKQDEYASSLGGINCFEFDTNGNVNHYPLSISSDIMNELEDNLLLFYTGLSHDTESILKVQEQKSNTNDANMINNLHEAKQIGLDTKRALENGNLNEFAYLVNLQWANKKNRDTSTTNDFLNRIHNDLIKIDNGGNKIIGSGGGGFIMAYCENKRNVRQYMKKEGLPELKFDFDFSGVSEII